MDRRLRCLFAQDADCGLQQLIQLVLEGVSSAVSF
jgi:hypothetical protein